MPRIMQSKTPKGPKAPKWPTARSAVRKAFGTNFGKVIVLAVLAAAIGSLLLVRPWVNTTAGDEVPFSVALREIKAGNVERAVVNDANKQIVLTLKDPVGERTGDILAPEPAPTSGPDAGTPSDSPSVEPLPAQDEIDTFEADLDGPVINATFPIAYTETLTDTLLRYGVPTVTTPATRSIWYDVLLTFVPVILILLLLLYFMRSYAGNIGKFGPGRGTKVGEVPETRLSDVAGCREAVEEMAEMVEFLNGGDRFKAVGASSARGALLVGPPGTGKTLLARAVAGEAGVPFFALAGSDFVETFVGVGARRVRDLFDRARKEERAIIFIDEIDAVGRARSDQARNYANTEQENTLISLLNEMDGFTEDQRIIVMAASNRAELLDPALTRPGRLDRQIQVGLPDRRGREEVLAVHAKGRPIAASVDFVTIARRTPGLSGADLAQIVNEACTEAARRDLDEVTHDCFDAAIFTVTVGRARTSALVTDTDREITAWHEAGHTIAALLTPAADDPISVSIVPRGATGGVTWMSGSDDQYVSRTKAEAQLLVSMAGRAAEEILLDGDHTQGAHGDLESASRLAWSMVTKFGMTDSLLVLPDEILATGGPVGDRARKAADDLLQEAHSKAAALLGAHRQALRALAVALLDLETMSAGEIVEVVRQAEPEAVADRPAAVPERADLGGAALPVPRRRGPNIA